MLSVRLLIHPDGDSGYAPIFLCDACSQPIGDPSGAMIFWDPPYTPGVATPGGAGVQATVAHKGKCDPRTQSSEELVVAIRQLMHNTMNPIAIWDQREDEQHAD